MIVITRADWIEAEDYYIQGFTVRKYDMPPMAVDDLSLPEASVTEEKVRGRAFIKPDGERIIIAATKEVQDIIGLQYEAWNEMESRSEELYRKAIGNSNLAKGFVGQLKTIETASFWRRLKWLFTGVTS